MSVQLQSRPASHNGTSTADVMPFSQSDLDAMDAALDRGDLETVRCLLGLSREVWRLVLAGL